MKSAAIVCFIALSLIVKAESEKQCHRVVVDGVVKAVMRDKLDKDWNRAELETPSNTVVVAVPAQIMAYSDLRRMIDAEVRIVGNESNWPPPVHFGAKQISAESPFEVLRPPPADPFAAPQLVKLSQVFNGFNYSHRHRIEGTVIAVRKRKAFVRSRQFRCIEVLLAEEEKTLPAVGMKVSAVGFAKKAYFRTLLCESRLRVNGWANPEEAKVPMEIDGNRLFTSKDNQPGKVNLRLNGKIVRIRGLVINGYTDGTDSILLRNGTHVVHVDMDFPDSGFKGNIPVGSSIEVTGLCRMEFEDYPSDTIIPRFKSFAIFPRAAADVKVLAWPPWWTPMRLTVVIILLIACIVAILVWNRMLKAQSERRGKALCQEQLNAAQAELKVEERTRLAVEIHDSMSQILTGTAMQIDAALRIGNKGFPAIEGYLRTARKMLASCRHELRCCIWDLKSRTFEEKDMSEVIERTVAPHTESAHVTVRFNVPRETLSDNTVHAILRIIRELTLNAIRHGHARTIRIAGELRDGIIGFSVKDDGSGFDPASADGPAQGHFGLQGIRERVSTLNGTVEVESSPGNGTKVTVRFAAERDEQ